MIDVEPNVVPSIALRCGLSWSTNRQSFFVNGERYVHDSPTNTAPTHDLAHILVAAVSGLPWCPVGSDFVVRLAEFNAVFCEHFCNNVFNHVYYGSVKEPDIVEASIAHCNWFVTHHYAPFPIDAAAARAQFVSGVHVKSLSRLSPIFFRQRWRELAQGMGADPFRVSFSADATPRADAEMKECQRVILEQWPTLCASASEDETARTRLYESERAELRRLRQMFKSLLDGDLHSGAKSVG